MTFRVPNDGIARPRSMSLRNPFDYLATESDALGREPSLLPQLANPLPKIASATGFGAHVSTVRQDRS